MTQTLTLAPTYTRVGSIDVLRGLVMVLMALDHARGYLHLNALYYQATDLATTTPGLFFTRWITHFCAPTFVFLAGTSAYLSGRKKTLPQLSKFLLTRGLWLLILEITVINFAFWFDITFSTIVFQVIWAIGCSMVVLSGLVWVGPRWVLGLGVAIVIGHNLLDPVTFREGTPAHVVWSVLHQPAVISLWEPVKLWVMYPVLPWIGVMCLGYAFGQVYSEKISAELRKRHLGRLGWGAIAGFLLLRGINTYGDPAAWSVQKEMLFTLMAFVNTTKYPPSLLYLLMTLGPALLLLHALEGKQTKVMRFFRVYGQVPLFYYILHFYVLHTLSVLSLLAAGIAWQVLDFQQHPAGIPPGKGLPLGIVHLLWLLVVLLFYPLCRWYHRFRSRQTSPFWRYL